MRLPSLLAAGLVALCAGAARADALPPSRLIPAEADVVLQVKDPVRLAKLLRNLDLLQEVQALAPVKEQLASTQARRARQLLAYAEKSLGKKWPALLEDLAGGGAAAGVKFGGPYVVVVQGKDEAMVQKFLELGVAVVRDELARQESKDKVTKVEYRGLPGYQIGNVVVARAGAALVVSNHQGALEKALDLHLSGESGTTRGIAASPLFARAGKLLPAGPLAEAWVNMKPIHQSQPGQVLYKTPRDNGALTVLFGSYLDVLGRSPFVCAGLYDKKDGFALTFRAPKGRDGMGADRDLHLPAAGAGGLPLLEPRGVLYASSFYLDVSKIWSDRQKLFPKAQADGLTKFDKTSGRQLAGARLSALLESAGARHRVVVATQPRVGYQRAPKQRFPAFAFVTEMRQPEAFARKMGTVLRTGGLLASSQVDMRLVEEEHHGCAIAGFRFAEKGELKADVNDVRFNFSPCFARVQDQFVFCSTIELCRELVDLLAAEKKDPGKKAYPVAYDRAYGAGFAGLLKSLEESLVTQTILDQAAAPDEAKEQVRALIRLVAKLGAIGSSAHFGKDEFRFDVRFRGGKTTNEK
jgi:hypothetical protein